ncbi:GNAT family N-acetyltransferase [Gilvimarinus polysaccharolyticus]|uniref:GNAT family N-acetyltransferase n=1 Tax=Gilvimarinus polysaccharolyticus TaxID=863921 RepID=UPI0006736927|nr:GNAT family N-acetyltransferase [Gilvimarinus polysaccharolyticus]
MDIEFKSIDLGEALALCVKFRRDTHKISYGNLATYNEEEVVNWFHRNKAENDQGFKHIFVNGKIAGQLEFRSPIKEDEVTFGYIYLIYLAGMFRNKGVGKLAQEYMFDQFKVDGCSEARLRYIPGNVVAEPFYLYTGWEKSGEVGPRGQLLVRKLA